ncbi:MAG: FliH/SctL family protein, partial [Fimbriimonadales bacterium]|nr:FliH/SctL family protein [Fimbriimonadales bacterium]
GEGEQAQFTSPTGSLSVDREGQAQFTSPPSPLSVNGEGEQARAAGAPPSPFTERGDGGVRLNNANPNPHPQPLSRSVGEGGRGVRAELSSLRRGRGGQGSEGKSKYPFPEYTPPTQPEDAPDLDALRAEAEAIRLRAMQDAERIREQARREGYLLGYEQGYAEGELHARKRAEAELRDITEQLHAQVEQVIQSLQAQCKAYMQNAEAQMLELALEVARKIVREELKIQPEHALAIVRDALRRMQGFAHIRIRVNPLDLELIRQNRATLLSIVDGVEGIEVVEDRRVDQGGCVIETEQGVYDARIRTQLGELERVIREAA